MYDPRIIEEFARRLLRRAKSVVVSYTFIGVLVGVSAALGVAPGSDNAILIGVLLGGVVGFAIGTEKAFQYRLTAQTALCQVMVEKNTRDAAHALAPQAPADDLAA